MVKKTANEKLNDSRDMPKIAILEDPKAIGRYGGNRLLIAPPLDYDALMKQVPQGKVTTSDRIRDHLARRYKADATCPLTAGIFINIVAQASLERDGLVTPYWRTLKKDGEINEKFPGGLEEQRLLLEGEGHKVIKKGSRYFVADYLNHLFDFTD